jgi:hypothetical protein
MVAMDGKASQRKISGGMERTDKERRWGIRGEAGFAPNRVYKAQKCIVLSQSFRAVLERMRQKKKTR